MKLNISIVSFIILMSFNVAGQSNINMSLLKIEMDEKDKAELTASINGLFDQINERDVKEDYVLPKHRELSISTFNSLKGMEKEKRKDSVDTYLKNMINCYKIGADSYFLSLSYAKVDSLLQPEIKTIFSFVAEKTEQGFQFAIPLDYSTRYWKNKVVGKSTYYFRSEINEARAKLFDKKNTMIAGKLEQEPEGFNFFMCDNYQELNQLMGFDYELSNNGRIRDGYGVNAGCIFSIQNNEDFSHDIFHYYSGKVNKRMDRNWVTEEGVAYWWGNAYYTDNDGNMITQDLLVEELKEYMLENKGESLYDHFINNKKDYSRYAPEVKMRSVLSGIICKEVDRQFGQEGLNRLITAGAKERMKKYLIEVEDLLSITEQNFDKKLKKLLFQE